MLALFFLMFISWFAGLQMGLTWASGVVGWLVGKVRGHVVRRPVRVRDLS